ncbi:MAG: DUF1939 domain-containing protein [Verrucomicrobia bacterium]|nr:DUF1939 domain-containing protein [Verrucomicrobiota bacterium]
MPICDIVLNHMAGGSGGDYKTYTYPDHHKFEKSTTDFHPSTLGHNDELAPYHHNWNFGAPEHHPLDVAFLARNMRSGFKQWGSWLVTDVLYGGFRFDLSEGVEPWLIWEWMSYPAQRGRFAFMEYWDGADGKQMQEWLNLTGKRAAIYDSNLRANYLKPMCNSNGAFDMRKLAPTNCFLGLEPEHTVVFIDNHDTWREGDTNKLGITSNKPLAYAYAFHSQGLPMVFYHDYYEKPYLSNSTAVAFGEPLTNKINRLIRIRKVAVAGNLEVLYSDTNLYIQLRLGNWQKSASILVLNDNSSETLSHSVETPWANTKIVDLVSGTAEVTTEANGSAYLGALPRGYRIYAPTNILQQVEE